jgi:DnaJ-class molecular chaperone
MKCKTCNGLGRTKATEFVGVDEGLRDVVILCPTCGGKGEIELTEQEYIQTCNTEQLAEWLQEHMDCASCGCNKGLCYQGYDCCKLDFVEWLKQPYKPFS